jgi:hypothetical protein|tara:strand:+ start:552 stop:830 length:279 start_codon:yes stop_codon:yes gene_type:complete
LIEFDADVNQARDDGATALYTAAQNGHETIVQIHDARFGHDERGGHEAPFDHDATGGRDAAFEPFQHDARGAAHNARGGHDTPGDDERRVTT